MTFKEAIKILKKEGFHMCLAPMVINQTGAIREFEKPEVCEAIKVANANKWTIGLSPVEWDEREARLKKEYGKNHIKHGDPIPCSPALKEAASQFNDALLDEQGKKIKRFGKEIARLNKIIHKKNLKIAEKDEVITDLGKELKVQKDITNDIKDIMDDLGLKYDGAKYNLALSEEVVKAKDREVCVLVERVNKLELMIKQYEGMLRLSEAGNDFKEAMLDHLTRMKPVCRKRKNTKK